MKTIILFLALITGAVSGVLMRTVVTSVTVDKECPYSLCLVSKMATADASQSPTKISRTVIGNNRQTRAKEGLQQVAFLMMISAGNRK